MPFVLRTPTPGARGIDSNTRITAAVAKAIAEWRDPTDGSAIEFVMRYLPLSGQANLASHDYLDAMELSDLAQAGLLVGVVQHVRTPPWTPSATRGSADGMAAVTTARAAGVAPGATIFYDLEGPALAAGLQSILDYDSEHTTLVKSAGYVPGGYFGYGVPLTADQMWHLGVERYWRAGGSAPPDPTGCGYGMRQLLPFDQPLCGIQVDFDIVRVDGLGRLPGFTTWG